jgi:hypothetical protein
MNSNVQRLRDDWKRPRKAIRPVVVAVLMTLAGFAAGILVGLRP